MKELVDGFDIELDLSDCTQLYDYATCQEVCRREGKDWDKTQFTGLGGTDHIGEADENMMLQVRKMDKSINDTGLLQSQTEEKKSDTTESLFSSFDDFNTSLDLPRRVLPIYKPGEVVKGQVILKLNKPVEADKLTLNLLGSGVVNIRIYHRYGYYDDTRHEKYIDDTKILWEKSKGKDVSEAFQSLVVDAPPSTSKTLPPGTHRFAFEFTIPMETSQSTPNIDPSSANYAYVVYRLKAKIDSGKPLGSGDVVTHKGIWVSKSYDIGADPEQLQPFMTDETLDTGLIFKSGKISIRATLPRKAYIRGESIPLSLEIDNQTKGLINKVSAYINMHGKFRLSDSKVTFSKRVSVKGEKMSLDNISAGMCPSIKWDLPWDFSRSSVDSNLMPTGTLDDCKLIDVKYDVIVKLKRSGMHRNLEVEIPIYVGNYNSRE